jgi:hypothetical protein
MRNTIIVALLIAGACADQPEPATEGPPPDTAGGRPDLSHPQVGATVAVTITDSGLQLSDSSIQSVGTGQVSFSVQNKGTATDALTINGGRHGTWKSTPIPPGQAVLMSMLMNRGEYELIWPGQGKQQKLTITIY